VHVAPEQALNCGACAAIRHFVELDASRLPALAAELVDRQVAVIAALGGTPSALAAKRATSAIPIVFLVGRDPVELGLVASFNRPGGNVTGVNMLNVTLAEKRLELVRELVPKAAVIAILFNPGNPNGQSYVSELEPIARSAGQRVLVLSASNAHDLDAAFAILVQNRVDAVVVAPDPFLDSRRDRVVELAARHTLPAIYQWREFVVAGGLISYGTSLADAHRQQGVYVGSILKGTRPADLPVIQPTKFELVINLKTAKALGLTVPLTLQARADEVIE